MNNIKYQNSFIEFSLNSLKFQSIWIAEKHANFLLEFLHMSLKYRKQYNIFKYRVKAIFIMEYYQTLFVRKSKK